MKPSRLASVSPSRNPASEGEPMKRAAIGTAMMLLTAGSAFAGGLFDDDCKYTSGRNMTTSAAGVTKVVIHAEAGSLKVDGKPGAAQIATTGTACTSDED